MGQTAAPRRPFALYDTAPYPSRRKPRKPSPPDPLVTTEEALEWSAAAMTWHENDSAQGEA